MTAPPVVAGPRPLVPIVGALIVLIAATTVGVVVGFATGPSGPSVVPAPSVAPAATAAPDLQRVDVQNISLALPADWEVVERSPHRVRAQHGASTFVVQSAMLESEHTAQGWLDTRHESLRSRYPDVSICGAFGDATVPNGPSAGRIGAFCYTLTTASARQIIAVDRHLAGIGPDGRTLFEIALLSTADEWTAFGAEAFGRVAPTIRWKLLEP